MGGKPQDDEGVEFYRRMSQKRPDYAHTWYRQGNTHALNEEYQKAIDCYMKALETRPDHVNALPERLQGSHGGRYLRISEHSRPVRLEEEAGVVGSRKTAFSSSVATRISLPPLNQRTGLSLTVIRSTPGTAATASTRKADGIT